MGFAEDQAGQAIRLSLGPGIGRDDVLRFADRWRAAYAKARARAA
jgi:cysteine desulfurase